MRTLLGLDKIEGFMALVKCKECAHEIYEKASSCINCGAPSDYYVKKSEKTYSYFVIFLSIIGILFLGNPREKDHRKEIDYYYNQANSGYGADRKSIYYNYGIFSEVNDLSVFKRG